MKRTLALDTDHFATLRGAARLHVSRGTLWLTIDGEPDDRVLTAGDDFELPPTARALVQALDAPALARVEAACPPWWQAVLDATRAFWARPASALL
jgi:hypothetical protein